MTINRFASILVALVALLATAAPAQIIAGPCFGDDGFNVGCCNIPQPSLPPFPPRQLGGTYGCILDCNLEAQVGTSVVLSAPNFVACDLAVINITVNSGAVTGPAFSGILLAKYARTWVESNPAGGNQRQVWRFLLNGDLNFSVAPVISTAACPIPPCALPPNSLPVHMTGSIDYAMACGPVIGVDPWSIALNLSHVTGCLNHAALSQRPLVGAPAHNDRNYVLIAPANFNFGPVAEPSGNLFAESFRSATLVSGPPFYQCFGEGQVANFGAVNTVFANCYGCSAVTPVGAPLWRHQNINGGVNCGPLTVLYPFNTIPVAPVFPAGMVTLSLGTYVGINPNQYPVGKSVSISYGIMQLADACLPNDFPFAVFTGVGVTGGAPASLFAPSPTAAPVFEFLDLQTMEIPIGAALTPGIGALFLPRKIWNLNTN